MWKGQREVCVVAAREGIVDGIAMTADRIYTIADGGTHTASGVPTVTASLGPVSLAVDHAGKVLISNSIFSGMTGAASRWAMACPQSARN